MCPMNCEGVKRMKDCNHEENETIDIPGTDETITICRDCGYEI